MVEETFSIQNAWSLDPPCFVRKVDRSGHWTDAATIQAQVFRPEPDGSISVYRVASATDLARVAIALNANRSSKTEQLFLVAITAEELAGITVQQTNGATLCVWANQLHYDLRISDLAQTTRLAETLVAAGRKPYKFTKKAMKAALDVTTGHSCHAAVANSARCACEDDLPAATAPSGIRRICRLFAGIVARFFRGANHPESR